jgi:uncharacterized protein
MKILISGGTGLVGSHTIRLLQEHQHDIVNLTTQKEKQGYSNGVKHVYWNPMSGEIDLPSLEGIDGVINLAGFSVANKWTTENKEKMITSRVNATRLLVNSIQKLNRLPEFFISASASGIYAPSDQWIREDAPQADDFLAQLSRDWEREAEKIDSSSTRLVFLRIGVVMDPSEGAIGEMLPIFRLGLGAAVGSGKQWMSWIHITDLSRMIVHCVNGKNIHGAYNACSPFPATNKEVSAALAKAIQKPFFLPNVPEFMLKLLFGEKAGMLLASRKLSSRKIQETGFTFVEPKIDSALKSLFKKQL